jgi:hypothetical protein
MNLWAIAIEAVAPGSCGTPGAPNSIVRMGFSAEKPHSITMIAHSALEGCHARAPHRTFDST